MDIAGNWPAGVSDTMAGNGEKHNSGNEKK